MLDLKLFIKNIKESKKKLLKRGKISGLNKLSNLLLQRKKITKNLQYEQKNLNLLNAIPSLQNKQTIIKNRKQLKILSLLIKEKKSLLGKISSKINKIALRIPNIPQDTVPYGKSYIDNVEIKKILKPKIFHFKIKNHIEIGKKTKTIDFLRGVKVSGSRFTFLKGYGSQLNRALSQFFIDFHTKKGDLELTPPVLVLENTIKGTGQLPKFKKDLFSIKKKNKNKLFLIPTSEVPLTSYLANEIVDEKELPIRICAHSLCFRAEAGAAGKKTKGLIRQYQFEKIEMVRFSTKKQANQELQYMVQRASDLLLKLELPHRIIKLCTADLGFSAEKTYDLEVWLPGQKKYREISSCSVFGTFQSNRLNIRYKTTHKNNYIVKPQKIITLNGSGLPLGRVFAAILENFQQKDGSVTIPIILRSYMNGLKKIPI